MTAGRSPSTVERSSDSPSVSRAGSPARSSSVGMRSIERTCDPHDARLDRAGGREDQRHLRRSRRRASRRACGRRPSRRPSRRSRSPHDSPWSERKAKTVLSRRPSDCRAPRGTRPMRTSDWRSTAFRYDSRIGFERRRRVGLDPVDDLLLGREPVLAVGVDDVVGHVRRPVVDVEEERLLAVRAQPVERAVERLARAEDVRLRAGP